MDRRGGMYGKAPEEMLRTWRESGGILDLSTIGLQWDGLKLEGNGSLAVDRQMRPLGAMSGQIYGAAHGIDALQALGRMTDKEAGAAKRSEEHTSELQSLMRISYAVFCLKKKKNKQT